MSMFKKALLTVAVAAGTFVVAAPAADAAIYYRRFAPVRRVVARTALPPYRIARRVVYAPRVVAPVVPVYRAPVVYAPGIYVGF